MQESSSLELEPSPLRDAMKKVLTAILPCTILPALDQQISRAAELGIFENQHCLLRRQDNFPRSMPVFENFSSLPGFLSMCTGQSFFQALCTIIVESFLLGTVQHMLSQRYVFTFDIEK